MKTNTDHRGRSWQRFLLCLTLLLGGFATPFATAGTIYEELKERSHYSTLVTAIDIAGLEDALSGEGSLTLFAPSNAAFAQIPEEDLNALLADQSQLTAVLTYHVLGEEIGFKEFESGSETTLQGTDVEITVKKYSWWFRGVKVDNSHIVRANIHASNGVIHGIDSVLDPTFEPAPSILEIVASDQENFSTLGELVELAGLADILASERRTWTVFAPTNTAFSKIPPSTIDALLNDKNLLRKVLLYHLLNGSKTSEDLGDGSVRTLARQSVETDVEDGVLVRVNDSEVAVADVAASNGTIHVISSVLLPNLPQSLTSVIAAQDELSTLETALGLTGQDEVFDSTKSYPSYTIFAPRNAAFPTGEALAALLEDPDALADVLGFHVVQGTLLAEKLRNGQRFKALNGGYLNIQIDDEGTVMVNNATVVTPNLRAANGVVHIIDAVLVEDQFTVADLIKSKSYLSTLAAALEATDLDDAVDGEVEYTVFAPLDSAFAALPDGTVEALLNDLPALSNILLFHVAPGVQTKSDLAESGGTTTLQGGELELEIQKVRFWWWYFNIITINDVRIVSTDLKADNGIVHLIAGVLLPPAPEEG